MTREELDALPEGAVVVSDGTAYQKWIGYTGEQKWYKATADDSTWMPELDFSIENTEVVWKP